ncbi:MAG: cyclic nucleotide-binding domain-containing protein [Anaerolineae bacterium]
MSEEWPVTAEELKKAKIFQGLSDAELEEIAHRARRKSYAIGEVIFHEGEAGESFYIVLSGQVRAWRAENGRERPLYYHPAGDFFGERALLTGQPRAATIDVVVDAELAVFDRGAFEEMLSAHPRIGDYLRDISTRRELSSDRPFKGKQWDEVGIAFERRHFFAFLEGLAWLIVLLGLWAAFSLLVLLTGSLPPAIVLYLSLAVILASLAWGLWLYTDWENDHYIITSRRVIRLERILFYFEKWEEAFLEEIERTVLITPPWPLIWFGFYDLAVQTTGRGEIRFPRLPDAAYFQELIMAERDKVLTRRAVEERTIIRRTLEESMGLRPPEKGSPSPPSPPPGKPGPLSRLLNFFIPRLCEKEDRKVTWRRHWLILVRMTGLPLLIWLVIMLLTIASTLRLPPLSEVPWAATFLPLLLLNIATFPWLLWKYADWRADIYTLDDRSVVDWKSTPFRAGGEIRTEIFLGDISRVTYSTPPGLIYQLLRYGHVTIESRIGPLELRDLYKPDQVQREISSRRVESLARARQEASLRQTEEMARWFREFYEMMQGQGGT